MTQITLEQKGQWLPADVQTPISLFLGLVGHRPGILLESAEVDGRLGRYSMLAWDFLLTLAGRDGVLRVNATDSRVKPLEELSGLPFLDGLRQATQRLRVLPENGFEDLPAMARGICGYFGYGLAGMFEPKLAGVLPPESAESTLVLPGQVVLFDHLKHRLCHLNLTSRPLPKLSQKAIYREMEPPTIGPVRRTPEQAGYEAAVAKAKAEIHAGEAIQVVLSTRFSASFAGEPFYVYRRLRQINPSPYMFFMRLPRVTLLGSSPELLVRCQNGKLTTCPIAGTRPRGEDEARDAELAEELLNDPKERAEHVMLVDLGRNDLGRIATPGSVKVERFMEVERFSHVMHISSYVTARLKDGLDAVDVLASTFPAGTVSGAPKVRAMEMIGEFEGLARGPYAGSIGWLGLDEGRVDLDTGITIRSLWVRGGEVYWQAGAGIVYRFRPGARMDRMPEQSQGHGAGPDRQGGARCFYSLTISIPLPSIWSRPSSSSSGTRWFCATTGRRSWNWRGAASSRWSASRPGRAGRRTPAYASSSCRCCLPACRCWASAWGTRSWGTTPALRWWWRTGSMHGKTSLVTHRDNGLFTGLPNPMEVCRYHSLLVEAEKAPDALEVTAWTDVGEVMGLRYKDRPWVGVQFHPESVLTPDGPKLLADFPDRIL